MKASDLTTVDFQNIAIALASTRVEGVQAAMALIVLHNKVEQIIKGLQAETNGNGNGTESDKPGANQPAPSDNRGNAGN